MVYIVFNKKFVIIMLLLVIVTIAGCNQIVTQSAHVPSPYSEYTSENDSIKEKNISTKFNWIETHSFHNNTLYFSDLKEGNQKWFTYDLLNDELTQKDWRGNTRVEQSIPLSSKERLDIERSDSGFILSYYTDDNKRIELTKALKKEDENYFVRISPDQSHILWIEQMPNAYPQLVVYHVSDNKTYVMQDINVTSITLDHFMNQVQLSPLGEQLFVQPFIYDTSTGLKLWRLPASYAVWSNTTNVIAYIDEINRNKLFLFYPDEDRTELLYEDLKETFIVEELEWNNGANFIAFATGLFSNDDQMLRYHEIHIMDIRGGYHHIENEINSNPQQISEFTFSPVGSLFSYVADTELKVVNLATGQAQVVLPQYLHIGDPFMIYTNDWAFYLEDNQIMMMDSRLQPKPMYQSTNHIFDFYYADDLQKLIVFEAGTSSQHLKVIPLNESDFKMTSVGRGPL